MKIYRNNQEIADASNVSYSDKFMSKCELSCDVKAPAPIDFAIGDYCLFEIGGTVRKLFLDDAPEWQKVAEIGSYGEAFTYTLKFVSPVFELERCIMKDIVLYDESGTEKYFTDQTTWSTFGSAQELANRIQANLDRLYVGDDAWSITVLEAGVPRLLNFDNTNAWNAVAMFNSEFGLKFTVENRTITVGTAGSLIDMTFRYGEGNGVYTISQVPDSDKAVVTRLFAFGGTNNIPSDYNKAGLVHESQYLPRLMLPEYSQTLKNYIESPNIASYGIREGTQIFDEIFPTIKEITAEELMEAGFIVNAQGRLDEIVNVEKITDPKQSTFTVYIKDCGFDLNDHILPGSTPMFSITDGALGGYEFEISSWKQDIKGNKLVLIRNQDNNYPLPNEFTTVAAGDHFVLLGIDMPAVYISAAEQRLLVKANEYLSEYDKNHISYSIEVDSSLMARRPEIASQLLSGNVIHLEDKDKDINEDIIIDSLSVSIDDTTGLRTYSLTLSNETSATTLEKIKDDLSQQTVVIHRNKTNSDKENRRHSQSLEALRDYIFDPDGNINDSFLRIMMLQVGADSMNYRLEKTSYFNNVGVNMTIKADRVDLGADILHHYAYQHSDNNSATWIIGNALTESLPNPEKPYFVAIKSNRNSDTAEWIVSEDSMSVEAEYGYYIFNFGIIYPVGSNGARDFKETRGITSAYGDTLIAGKITSLDGYSWWDLSTGEFLLGAPGKTAFSFIGGELKMIAYDKAIEELSQIVSTSQKEIENIDKYINTTLAGELENLTKQIDKTVESWFYPYVPTLVNYPAFEWTTDELKKAHIGDTFTNTQPYIDDSTTPEAGKSWRWVFETNLYKWTPIADSDAVKALKEAAMAKDVADGKRRVFVTQPTDSDKYDVGDLWVNASYGSTYTNDILRCISTKVSGTPFAISHWVLASKYTDDTAANEAINMLETWASDEFISPVEKTALEQQQANIQAEHEEIISQANKYGLSTQAYEKAYIAAITALTKYTAPSPENVPVESDYSNISAYYTARAAINESINSATKEAVDDLDYLKETLKEGKTTITQGVVLSGFIGVTDETGNKVQAGINGSNKIGYDSDHGKMMMFSGASDISKVSEAPVRIYEDGSAFFNKIIVIGSAKSPFVPFNGAIVVNGKLPDLSDNLAMANVFGGLLDVYFQWDVAQNGRTITIVNYLFNTTLSNGWIAIHAPEGKFFFENGIKTKDIYIGYECITLKGYGTEETFIGWIVISRTGMPTNAPEMTQKIVYQGFVNTAGVMGRFRSAGLGTLSSSRISKGNYDVYFPKGQTINVSNYFVMLTPVRATGDTGPRTAFITGATDTGFSVGTTNGSAFADAGFAFQVIRNNDWIMYEDLTKAESYYLRLDGVSAEYRKSIDATAQTLSIPIETDGTLQISIKSSWINSAVRSGGNLKIDVARNDTGARREGEILLSIKQDATAQRRITLNQSNTASYYLTLDGIKGDRTFVNQPAEGVTLTLAVESNGTVEVVSQDSRLTVALSAATNILTITVPRNTTSSPIRFLPVVVGVKEDRNIQSRVNIGQEVAVLPVYYQIRLNNQTTGLVTFRDSTGGIREISPNFNVIVTIGGADCQIMFDHSIQNVVIYASDNSSSVWSAIDIQAGLPMKIDTSRWLAACAAGKNSFLVLG